MPVPIYMIVDAMGRRIVDGFIIERGEGWVLFRDMGVCGLKWVPAAWLWVVRLRWGDGSMSMCSCQFN